MPFSEFAKAKTVTIALIVLAKELETAVGNSQQPTCHSVCMQHWVFVRIVTTILFTLSNAVTSRLATFWFDHSLLHCPGK